MTQYTNNQTSILSKTKIKEIIKNIIPSGLIVNRLGPKASNSILFTFDDGPDEDITPLVLDRLEDYRVRAVFFIVGRFIDKAPHILKEIEKRGHLIGNHTYGHSESTLRSFFSFRNDIVKCQSQLKGVVDTEPVFFRPPKGKITFNSVIAPKTLKLKTILWSREGGEWGQRKKDGYDTIGKILLETITPRDIILLHDNNPKVPKILDIVLPAMKSRNIDLYNGVNDI
jgi:peptidoglycan/xylan/chitin deacetylase (PgdA/CDA1 family)